MQKLAFTIGMALMLVHGTYAQLNMTLLGNYTYTSDLSDIWGHVDSLGNEYAIVGVQNGVSVVDVTNPATLTEVYFVSGPNSIWRDIKVWDKHAYITNESSGGLTIIDLSNLPDPAFPTVATYGGSSFPFTKAHDIFIDENGIAYILGANYSSGGAIMLDLTIDPMNPIELGVFNTYYLHDAMVRGDTLWGAAINNGFFVVVDVSNKSAPSVLATQNTPGNFTHNCWISDDGNTLFTTDEVSGAYLGSYDVSNVLNIAELDRVQSNPGSGVIVHNTYVINDFLVTSYYRDGVTIHDVTRPGNMIQTGYYDTYPMGSGNGFNGAWGVYPWLPSGNVIVSDIENGLHILGATYIKGCYLEGTVTDLNTSNPINNATIEILVGVGTTTSDLAGDYAMAILSSGTYNVVFSAPGYTSDTLIAVLSNGVLVLLDAQLVAPTPFVLSGQVIEGNGGNPIANADILITNTDFQYALTSDGSGNFLISPFFEGTYNIVIGKWLYKTTCSNQYLDSNISPIIVPLDSGLYDDFSFDFGWGITGSASSGMWERGEPVGTNWIGIGDANPDVDINTDCGDQAYVTGNAGGSAANDDVDNGNTIVKSPLFDLTGYTEPYVRYHRWYFNNGGSGTPDDTLSVSLSNGVVSVVLEEVIESSPGNSSWIPKSYKVSDYIAATSTMQLTFETADLAGSGHLVEAGLDMFRVEDYTVSMMSLNASCNGVCDAAATVVVLGGVPPLSYIWDDPTAQTTDTAFGLCAGLYTATVIDSLGDTATAQVTITQPNSINLSTTTIALCNPSLSNITVTASNGVAPYAYAWNDPGNQTTQTATSLSIGTYVVTVTDNNGCSNTISITTTSNITMTISTSGTDPSSCGSNDGTTTATVTNGVSPFTYSWDDPGSQATAIAVGLPSGTYTVIVTDGDGCSDTGVVVLSAPGAPVLTIGSISMPTCNGGNDGSATVTATGPPGPFFYAWNTIPVQTDSIAIGLGAGSYIVNVTSGTCASSISVIISEPAPVTTSIIKTDVLCFGDSTGAVDLSVIGGMGPFLYSWSNGETVQDVAGLAAGTYFVAVTDFNGCSANDSLSIAEPPALIAATAVFDVVCAGDSNGSIDLTTSGGVSPYSYNWSEGSNTEDISNLQAGTYLLVLGDSNGCSTVENVPVGTQSAGAQTSPITGTVAVNQNSSEFYAVTPNTGSVYNWSISGGTQTGGGQGNSITVQWTSLGTGQVAVVETDSLGCVGDTVFLNVSIVTSINEYGEFPINVIVYPNPNRGLFVLKTNLHERTKLSLTIYNLIGEQIYSENIGTFQGNYTQQIDLSDQAGGIYYVQIIADKGASIAKIIVE
ncbi:MAG: choice-of-anchor B family protein [Flavobacteriales bacterium]|nr:choice-of-anchor B family protein [Flavobacteriales bacterium]